MSLPRIGPIERAAASRSRILVASTTSSHGPASAGFIVADGLTVRSPLTPLTCRPFWRIASMCSRQTSTSHTSWPAAANKPP